LDEVVAIALTMKLQILKINMLHQGESGNCPFPFDGREISVTAKGFEARASFSI